MIAAARENDRGLKGCFGRALWKVAFEPECRTSVCREVYFGRCRSKHSRPIPVSG